MGAKTQIAQLIGFERAYSPNIDLICSLPLITIFKGLDFDLRASFWGGLFPARFLAPGDDLA
jgi:hypothetical protein